MDDAFNRIEDIIWGYLEKKGFCKVEKKHSIWDKLIPKRFINKKPNSVEYTKIGYPYVFKAEIEEKSSGDADYDCVVLRFRYDIPTRIGPKRRYAGNYRTVVPEEAYPKIENIPEGVGIERGDSYTWEKSTANPRGIMGVPYDIRFEDVYVVGKGIAQVINSHCEGVMKKMDFKLIT